MKKIILALMTVSVMSVHAGNNNIDTLKVKTTPAMHCANCENKIKTNIRFVKGTKKIITSVPEQTVTIIYDNRKTNFSDYIKAFRKIGFEITKR